MSHTKRLRALSLGAAFVLAVTALLGILPAGSSRVSAAELSPDISYVTEGVDEGASLVIMGDHFTPTSEVWLYRPQKDDAAVLKKRFSLPKTPLPAQPPSDSVKTAVLGQPEPQMIAAGQIGYPNIAVSNSVVPTVAWVKNESGISKPYMLNKPELYFAADAEAVPGQRLRVFGRNMETKFEVAGPDYDYPVALKNKQTGVVYWGQTLMDETQERANIKSYVLNVLLPKELPAGDYELSVHTLYGGDNGWSNPLPIKVVAQRDFVGQMAHDSDIKLASPASTSSLKKGSPEIVKVSGLEADGIHDDTDKIQKAIDKAAQKGGGLVLLPAGTIAITKTLQVKENVVLAGAGRAATQIIVAPTDSLTGDFPLTTTMFNSTAWVKGFAGDYGPYLKDRTPMVWMTSKSGLQDVTVIAGNGADIGVLVGAADPQKKVKDTFIKRSEIVNKHTLFFAPQDWWGAYMGGVLVVSATEGFTLTDSSITASNPLYMLSGRYPHAHANITNDVFDVPMHNNTDNVFTNSIAESVIENNTITNGARAFTSQMGMWRNWIAGNTISNIGGRANASEVLMSEDGYVMPFKSGKVTAAAANSATLDTALGLKDNEITTTGVEFYTFIKNGTGMGQYRRIIGNSGDHMIKLDSPWTVLPDNTSEIDLIRGAVKNLFVNNWISDTRGSLQFSYGAGLDNVVAGNHLNNTGGITVFGGVEDWTDSAHPYLAITAYNLIYANFLLNTDSIFIKGSIGSSSYGKAPVYATGGVFANTIRRNQVWSKAMASDQNQYYNTWLNGPDKGADSEGAINVKDSVFTIIEANYIYNTTNGIQVDGGRHTIIRTNRMDDVLNRIIEKRNPFDVVKTPPSWEAPY